MGCLNKLPANNPPNIVGEHDNRNTPHTGTLTLLIKYYQRAFSMNNPFSAPYIIAEIASSHDGDPSLAGDILDHCIETGANAVKFQIFRRDHLMSPHHPGFDNFGEIEIAWPDWHPLLRRAAESPLDLIVEAFDEQSLQLVETLGCVSAYKLPTSDIANPPFMAAVIATAKPFMIGVGGATNAEIEAAVEQVHRAKRQAVLLHGFQSYPTQLPDTNLARLKYLSGFGLPVGYADHIDAEDRDLARLVPAMALGAGATVIEKHITDDRSRKGRDHYSALNPDEFKSFVSLIRQLFVAIGNESPDLTEPELRYRHNMKRQAVAGRSIEAGTRIDYDHVDFKRTDEAGIGYRDFANVVGQRLKSDKQSNDPIRVEDLSNE